MTTAAETRTPSGPTGPFHSFQALPCPLPAGAQERLKTLSAALKEASANQQSEGQDAAGKIKREESQSTAMMPLTGQAQSSLAGVTGERKPSDKPGETGND